MERALNIKEASAFLGLAPQTLYKYRFSVVGPAWHKIGSRIVYRVGDLEDFMSRRRVDPEARQVGR